MCSDSLLLQYHHGSSSSEPVNIECQHLTQSNMLLTASKINEIRLAWWQKHTHSDTCGVSRALYVDFSTVSVRLVAARDCPLTLLAPLLSTCHCLVCRMTSYGFPSTRELASKHQTRKNAHTHGRGVVGQCYCCSGVVYFYYKIHCTSTAMSRTVSLACLLSQHKQHLFRRFPHHLGALLLCQACSCFAVDG